MSYLALKWVHLLGRRSCSVPGWASHFFAWFGYRRAGKHDNFVGASWLPLVVLQIRLRDAAFAASSVAAWGQKFHAGFRWWFALGLPAFAGMLVLFGLMVGRAYFV